MFGLGKKLAKKYTDNLVSKTLTKSGLSTADKTAFKTNFDSALERSNFDEVIDSVDKVQTMVATTAATVLVPGLSKLISKPATSGPLSAGLDTIGYNAGPLSASKTSSLNLPLWLAPVAIAAIVLFFGKKLFR